MPLWNESPGAGMFGSLSKSYLKALKHGAIAGGAAAIIMQLAILSPKYIGADPTMAVLNFIAAVFVAGPWFGMLCLAPLLNVLYKWAGLHQE